MPKDSPHSDWRVTFLEYILLPLFECSRLKWLRAVLLYFFLMISPNIPVDLRKGLGDRTTKQIFFTSFGMAFFFCFVVTALLCFIEGTLWGGDSTRRSFVEDGWNISLYTIVSPTYVALVCYLIALTMQEWSVLTDYVDAKVGPDPRSRSPHRLAAVLFLVFLLCAMFITNYMHDILNPSPSTAAWARVYWFMDGAATGQRTLNRVGYYYVVLNFSLLFLTLLGVTCFLSLAFEVLRAGRAEDVSRIDSFDVLGVKLKYYTTAYLLMKCLAATYMTNYFVWASSPLGKTQNLFAALIALSVVGGVFVAIPRQYIELKWYILWSKSGKLFEYADTRPWWVRRIVMLIDTFFVAVLLSQWNFDIPHAIERLGKWLSNYSP